MRDRLYKRTKSYLFVAGFSSCWFSAFLLSTFSCITAACKIGVLGPLQWSQGTEVKGRSCLSRAHYGGSSQQKSPALEHFQIFSVWRHTLHTKDDHPKSHSFMQAVYSLCRCSKMVFFMFFFHKLHPPEGKHQGHFVLEAFFKNINNIFRSE